MQAPFLKVLVTPIEFPAWTRSRDRILSWLARVLLGLLLCSALTAQQKHKAPHKKHKAPPAKAQAAGTKAAPEEHVDPLDAVVQTLLRASLEHDPGIALRGGWSRSGELPLGTYGTDAAIAWRAALDRARARLARLRPSGPSPAQAEVLALRAWVESELLLVDSLGTTRTDPARYVRHVTRTLEAVRRADGLDQGTRTTQLARFLFDLPAYWRDARTSLVSPSPVSIESALLELDELEELVAGVDLVPYGPPAPGPAPSAELDPARSVTAFREWLLDERAIATTPPDRLGPEEWTRFVQLRTGCAWTRGQIKARCLRDLAAVTPAPVEAGAIGHTLDGKPIARAVWNTSARTLALGQLAGWFAPEQSPDLLRVLAEPAAPTRVEPLELSVAGDALVAAVHLPDWRWSRERSLTRADGLQPRGLAALGVRYGLAGEGAWMLAACRSKSKAALLDHRELREGLGLFALDWTLALDVPENPLHRDPEIEAEFARQRGLEAARLLAALELHAEEASLAEVQAGLQRRTGMDAETAYAEAVRAVGDPAWGLGTLVLYELRALESALAASGHASDARARTIGLALQHPHLRPVDLSSFCVEPEPAR